MEILGDLLFIGLAWIIIYKIFYSREAQVRRILKSMYNLPIKFSRFKRDYGKESYNEFNIACIEQLEGRYKFINALLDYRFDPEVDKGYIQENKTKAENRLHCGKEIMLKDN